MSNFHRELINSNRDGTTQDSNKIAAAKTMLKHYFWIAFGGKLDEDNCTEIEGIIDDLYDRILEDVKKMINEEHTTPKQSLCENAIEKGESNP